MKLSVRSALTGLWILLFAICVGLAFFLTAVYQQSGENQIKASEKLVKQSGDSIFERYQQYIGRTEGTYSSANKIDRIRTLNLLLSLVLVQFDGIEGGFWTDGDDFFSYAFPTYGGRAVEKDLPSSELNTIRSVTTQVLKSGTAELTKFDRERRCLIVYARPVNVLGTKAVLWTMGWTSIKNTTLFTQVVAVLIVLFLCSAISGLWLTSFMLRWSRNVAELERSISNASTDELPDLKMTGQPELDRLVLALNQVNQRLRDSRTASDRLSKELARVDRLSGLGRIVAGFAHEIRNPLATIILSAENALENAEGLERRQLENILTEAQGLEILLQKLLTVAKLNELKPSEVNLSQWCEERVEQFSAMAQKKSITIEFNSPDAVWSFDKESVSRAVANLILNAIQNTPDGGWIKLEADIGTDDVCRLSVEDSGSGVAEIDRENIFEPLVSGRSNGVGIGLTIVKEVAHAHAGMVCCTQVNAGAKFIMEIPWLKS